MKKIKSLLSLLLTLAIVTASFAVMTVVETSAATYTNIPAFKISRVYQPDYDTGGHCYWASIATVQGYCLGSYTYGNISTNYRVPGQDYNYLSRGDALSKYFQTLDSSTYANNANNLKNKYPVKMTRVTEGIGKNAATYQAIYNQLVQGKPVVIYTGTHASVVIGYSGSTSTLDPKGFTVLEVKKDKANTSSGYWWENSAAYYNKHANSPQIDSNTLKTNGTSYMSCYVNLASWIEYCGNNVQEICYPTDAVVSSSTFSFNANGASGSMPSLNVTYGEDIVLPENGFEYEGYTFEGYNVFRTSDNTWYCGSNGWQKAQSVIDNNYSKKIYSPGQSYLFNFSWLTDGGVMGTEFVFYPVWKPLKSSLDFYQNNSGTNYMMTLDKDNFDQYYQSRDTSTYTISLYESTGSSPCLVIEGKTAGAVGKDLLFKTQTNKSPNYENHTGDNKKMTLTFRAKASVDNTNMIFRWGYTSDIVSVNLSTEWQTYYVDMSKQINDGAHFHPYFDKAGTFLIYDIALIDLGANDPDEDETGDLLYTKEYVVGSPYGELPTPTRAGYTFKGWYTSKYGGSKITKNTIVPEYSFAVYARWEEGASTEIVLLGDTDQSGTVNVKDATLIQKGIAGISALSAKEAFAGNVIASDVLNVRDATTIQKWCAGIDTGSAIVNSWVAFTA